MNSADRPPYLLNRDGRYYFRRPIPSDLRSAFDGKREFKVALRTADEREARRKLEHHTRETSNRLEAARARLPPQSLRTFATAELRAFADEVKALWLKADEEMRLGASAETLEELKAATSVLVDVIAVRPAHRQIRAELDGLLKSKALVVPKDSPGYLQLAEAVRSGCEEALRGMLAREQGRWVPTPPVSLGALPLSQVFDKWTAAGGIKGAARPKSLAEARRTLDALVSLHGDLPIGSLTKAHERVLRDHLRSLGHRPATIRKKLGLINAVLAFAVREHYIEDHPFKESASRAAQ